MPNSSQQQFEIFSQMLEGKRDMDKSRPVFSAVLDWLKLPLELQEEQKERIKRLVKEAFNLRTGELEQKLTETSRVIAPMEQERLTNEHLTYEALTRNLDATAVAFQEEQVLQKLLPKEGFFKDYTDFTSNSEAPLAYHVYCALAGLVAIVNRRVFYQYGQQKLFPPLGVLILGPSGIKKTSAADIMVNILNDLQLTPVYAEKLTPEALIDAMRGGNATGLVYAPEMTVLVNRQRYMESIIPLLTRFMDSPDIWKSGTIMRGKGELTEVAITCLMCSTLDWFIKNTPESVFGGGFIARNIMVLQEASSRIIALPEEADGVLRNKIILQLCNMHEIRGEMTLTPKCKQQHIDWYVEDKKKRIIEHDLLETYYQRKPSHLLRFAMMIHLSTHHTLEVCLECWHTAFNILQWTEKFLPSLAVKMFKTSYGEDADVVLRKIRAAGGKIGHSELIRRLQYHMGASQTRILISNLKEANLVHEIHNSLEHSYLLTERRD